MGVLGIAAESRQDTAFPELGDEPRLLHKGEGKRDARQASAIGEIHRSSLPRQKKETTVPAGLDGSKLLPGKGGAATWTDGDHKV